MANQTLHEFLGERKPTQLTNKTREPPVGKKRIKTYATAAYVHHGPLISDFWRTEFAKSPQVDAASETNVILAAPQAAVPPTVRFTTDLVEQPAVQQDLQILVHSAAQPAVERKVRRKLLSRRSRRSGTLKPEKQAFLDKTVARLAWETLQHDPSVPWWASKVIDSEAGFAALFKLVEPRASASLLKAILSTSPPTVDFWRNLPGKARKNWAVYSILMEKTGHPPEVYIGSASNAKTGLLARWPCYDDPGRSTPVGVLDSLSRGFEVTHKGVLLDMPRPRVVDMPKARFLTHLLEAAMAYAFWAMSERQDIRGMDICCLWDLESIPYRGLCGHSAIREGVYISVILSPEELVERARTQWSHFLDGQRRRDNERAKRNENRYVCTVCGIKMSRKANLKAHMAVHSDQRFFCTQPGCNKSYTRKDKLKKHKAKYNH